MIFNCNKSEKLLLITIVIFQLKMNALSLVARSDWGAKPPKLIEKFDGPIPFVIIHHSYTPKACNDTIQCKLAMQQMQIMHQDGRGWNDIGYSFAIGGDGQIYEGRGFNVIGAHAPRYNDKSIGICIIGDYRDELPSKIMLDAAQKLIEYGVGSGLIGKNYTLLGHRQVRNTECPGDRLFKEISTWTHFSPFLDVVNVTSINNDTQKNTS